MSRVLARRRTVRISALVLGLVAAPALGATASADSGGSVTPFVDCVTTDATTGLATAYFGYSNTTGSELNLAIGDDNQLFPVSPNSGQPTAYDPGTYSRVFAVQFDPQIFPDIAWILDGVEADALSTTPACVNGLRSRSSAGTDLHCHGPRPTP